MKPEHRHELKTNELAEWIANFPQWARENRTTIICVSVLAVVVAGLYIWKWYYKNVESVQKQLNFTNLITQLPQSKMRILQAQAEGMDISYMLIQTADNLQAAARDAKNDQMAALALIKRAEALRAELHYRAGTVSKQDLRATIKRAKANYTKAVEKSSSNPSLMATAKFGLGLCEEEMGNFEKARQIYSDIATNSRLEGTTAIAQAKQRLKTMADYQQKVIFKKSPKPAPAKLIQPQIKLKAPDSNLGAPDAK